MQYEFEILRKIWKAENWPQLYFHGVDVVNRFSPYNGKVGVGNCQIDILIPYEIEGNRLTLPGKEYSITYLKQVEREYPYGVNIMEWVDKEGQRIYFRQLERGEPRVPLKKMKIPF